MLYKNLKERNPEYKFNLWEECRAFYSGGDELLGNDKLMDRVFPRHMVEHEEIYKERKSRAFYVPYAGEIIDAIIAGLFADDLKVEIEPDGADPYYDDLFDDVSPPKGEETSLSSFMKKQILTALQCKIAWTLIDFPDAPEQIATKADEDKLGVNRAYLCEYCPENVLDWEESEDGDLDWVLIVNRSEKRGSIGELRGMVTERFTYYDRAGWVQYEHSYKKGETIDENKDVPEIGSGTHSFGCVPIVRLQLSDGLWAMGKLLSIAKAHFNLRNGLSWSEIKSLFQVLVAFLDGERMDNVHSQDSNRAVNQVYGPGYILQYSAGDRLEYVGPNPGPYEFASKDLNNLRDEMHRVLHQMALSVDNSGAALQRSADSKQVDQEITQLILREFGKIVREHVKRVYGCIFAGRNEESLVVKVSGLENHAEQSIAAMVEQAGIVDTISIPSATFKIKYLYRLIRRVLDTDATDDDMAQILQELENNIHNEDFLPSEPPPQLVDADQEQIGEEEIEEYGEEDLPDDEPTGTRSVPMYNSRR
jgi:hypothetical protein